MAAVPEVSVRELDLSLHPPVEHAVQRLQQAAGSGLVAVVFFGSRLVGTSPGEASAADLFVVVDDYEPFYEATRELLRVPRSARSLARLNRFLPPNVLHLSGAEGAAGAKCFVIRWSDFLNELGEGARDHFCRGRLVQRVAIAYARGAAERHELQASLDRARDLTLDWVPSYLDGPFSAAEYCRRMLEVSYSGEIRPESADRVGEVFEAQRGFLEGEFASVLQRAVDRGALVAVEGSPARFAPARAPSWGTRRRWNLFFRVSKLRATVRWLKYVLTFDDWLDYLARKAERRTGVAVNITPVERKLPFLLLWPKVFRVLRATRSSRLEGGGR